MTQTVNITMLTPLEKERLNHSNYIISHLRYFCQKWSNDPECPQHFEDMMRRFLEIGYKAQKNFYVIDDILYTIDQVQAKRTTYRLINPNNHKHRGDQYWTSHDVKTT